jgi:hypothetical protein
MDDYLKEIPEKFHQLFQTIVSLTDPACEEHLNEEYRDMCREMVLELCVDDTPMARGKPLNWAAGIVHAVGWMNFLHDPGFEPHMTAAELAKRLSVSHGTMMAKSRIIRSGLDLMQFDPTWCLPSLMGMNPLSWMVEVDGFIVDAREMSAEFQQSAFEAGLIPSIPDQPDNVERCGIERVDDDSGQVMARIRPASG